MQIDPVNKQTNKNNKIKLNLSELINDSFDHSAITERLFKRDCDQAEKIKKNFKSIKLGTGVEK
jgi:hypothetical protein